MDQKLNCGVSGQLCKRFPTRPHESMAWWGISVVFFEGWWYHQSRMFSGCFETWWNMVCNTMFHKITELYCRQDLEFFLQTVLPTSWPKMARQEKTLESINEQWTPVAFELKPWKANNLGSREKNSRWYQAMTWAKMRQLHSQLQEFQWSELDAILAVMHRNERNGLHHQLDRSFHFCSHHFFPMDFQHGRQDTETYIVAGSTVDEMQSLMDDHIIKVQTMKGRNQPVGWVGWNPTCLEAVNLC